jgi:hypothetical protein
MSFTFQPHFGLVLVVAELEGPNGTKALQLALDLCATTTLLDNTHLVAAGYDPTSAPSQSQVTTGSGTVIVPKLSIDRLKALAQERTNFPVIAHTLPANAGVDGLLGLDFFRGSTLTLDFRGGLITLV